MEKGIILKKHNKIIAMLLALILIVLTPMNAFAMSQSGGNGNPEKKEYQDIKGHWAEKEIRELINKGIVNGKKEGETFLISPNDNITRGEFITLIVKSIFSKEKLNDELATGIEASFTDSKTHWAKDYIAIAEKYGLIGGYKDGTIRPDKKISRAEIVTIIIRAAKIDEEKAESDFSDADKNHWAYKNISIAAEKGLVSGYEDNTFKPEKSATRAEAMVVIKRALDSNVISLGNLETEDDIDDIEDKFKLTADKKSVYMGQKVNLKLECEDEDIEYSVVWKNNGGKLDVAKDNKNAIWKAEDVGYRDYTITVEILLKNDEEEKIEKSLSINVKRKNSSSSSRSGNNSSHTADPDVPQISISQINGNVVLSWNKVTGAASYTIKRGESSGQYTTLASNITETTYTDTSVDGTTTYYYVVTAINSSGESKNSNEVVYKVEPKAPKLFGSLSTTTATLNWTKSNGADSYKLYRSTVDGGPYILLSENLLVNTYEDTGLTEDVIYYYVVKAVNDIGESEYSNQVILGSSVVQQNTFNPDIDDDGDGLTNIEELTYGTNHELADTDKDGLTDGYEVQIGTDPLDPDTDSDGIYDGAETTVGTDPLTANASVSATKEATTGDGTVVVTAKGDANLLIAPLQVTESDNVLLNSLDGAVKTIDITAGGYDIDEATIAIKYDESNLKGVSEDDLTLYYVNPETKQLEELTDVVIDKDNNTITGKTTHFSTYLLGDKSMPVDLSKVDIVFVIDQSGSMSENDPNFYRILATKKFVNNMDEVNSRIGIVEFESLADIIQELTNDKQLLIDGLEYMQDNFWGGGTNIYDALVKADSLLADKERTKVAVLLTDGQTMYESDTKTKAVEMGSRDSGEKIVINTVALGSDADSELLQYIASETKGGYFYIDNTGGLSQEDVDKQIELLYEKLSKQLTLQLEAEENNSLPEVAVNLEFSDLYKGFDNKAIMDWITRANTNLLTGNYMDHQVDIDIESEGINLTFERTYNSFGADDKSAIGNGFRTNYDSQLEIKDGSGIVTASALNVRKDPWVGANNKIGLLSKGTQVEIEVANYNNRNWHKIKFEKNGEDVNAYVSAKYIQEIKDAFEVTYPSGTRITFKKKTDGTNTYYEAPSNSDDKLEKVDTEYILTKKDQSKYVYQIPTESTSGKLVRIEDRYGNALNITYNGGKIKKVTDPVGRSLTFSYTGGLITKVTGPMGRTVEYSYKSESKGDFLTEVKDLEGNKITYDYDNLDDDNEPSRINKIVDANGHQITRNEYDIIGRIVRQYDGEDNIKYFIYDDVEHTRYFIDENGNESRIIFNGDLKPISETDVYGGETTYQYFVKYEDDDNSTSLNYFTAGTWTEITDIEEEEEEQSDGSTTTSSEANEYEEYVNYVKENRFETKTVIADKLGNTTTKEYDKRGSLVKATDAKDQEIVMTYDENDNLISKTDKKGDSTNYTYDLEGIRLIKVTDRDDNDVEYTYYSTSEAGIKIEGLIKTVEDKNGNTTTYKYEDQYNNLTSEKDELGNEIAYKYDMAGRKAKEIDPKLNETTFEYDDMDRVIKETDPYNNSIINEYDKVGNLIAVTDKNSNKTQYEYDDENRPVKVIDPLGYEESYSYDPIGNKIKEIDKLGREIVYSYDALNRLVKITDPLGGETEFEYDEVGNKTKEIDQLNRETSFEYDILYRLTEVTDSLGNTESYAYDENDNRTSFTNKNGDTTSYYYDNLDILIKVEYPFSYTEEYTYDANSNKLTYKDMNDEITTYTYDKTNRVKTEKLPNAANDTEVTTYEYDENGNQIKVVDPLGKITEMEYDKLNRLLTLKDHLGNTEQYKYDEIGNKIEVIDPKSRSTYYEYDELNRVVKVADAYNNSSKMVYDGVGNNIEKTDKRGNKTEYKYDDLNRLVEIEDPYGNTTNYEYDSVGNKTAFTDPKSTKVSYEYDDLNRQVKIIDENGYTTEFTYDALGNKESQIDPEGNEIEYTYDSLNRLIKVTDPELTQTYYTYDGNGNLLTQTNGNGNITSYEYNELNKPVKMTDSLGKEETYTYGIVGNLITKTDRNGVTTTNTYDDLYRLIKVEAGSILTTYSYDELGNRVSMTDEEGTTEYEYDKLNRLTKETTPDDKSITYEYDEEGNKIKVVDQSGKDTEYTYDDMNRLETVTTADGTTTYEYDENGNRKTLEYPNATKTEYSYDYRNLLISMVNTVETDTKTVTEDVYYNPDSITDNGAEIFTLEYEYEYGYDKNGNQTYKVEPTGRTDYSYDSLNRLKTVTDIYGRVTTYEYDEAGNRIREEINVPIALTSEDLLSDGAVAETVCETVYGSVYSVEKNYYYDDNNRLTKIMEENEEGNEVKKIEYIYDDNGNQLSVETTAEEEVTTESFSYDEFNRLTEVNKDEKSMLYTYNGDGLRRTKEVDGATTTFYYAGKKVIYEEDSEGNKYNNTLGINLIARSDGSQTNYYLYNGHADVVLMVDEDGVRKNIYDYDAFGNIIKEVENGVNNPYRYAQYYYDEETDYYYLKARFYNPYIGRFISEDSYRGDTNDPLSLNLYTYCSNSPVMLYDQNGHFWHIIAGAVIGGGIDVASQLIGGKSFSKLDWGSVGKSAVVGAVTAAIPTASLGVAAAVGAGSNIAAAAWNGNIDSASDALYYGGVGAVLGGISHGAGRLASKGMASRFVKNSSKSKIKGVLRGRVKSSDINKAKLDVFDRGVDSEYYNHIVNHFAERTPTAVADKIKNPVEISKNGAYTVGAIYTNVEERSIRTNLNNTWETTKTGVSNAWEATKTGASNVWEATKTKTSKALEETKARASNTWKKIGKGWKDLLGSVDMNYRYESNVKFAC